MCKTKFVGAVKSTDTDSDDGSAWFLGAVIDDRDLDEDKWLTDLLINGTTVQLGGEIVKWETFILPTLEDIAP